VETTATSLLNKVQDMKNVIYSMLEKQRTSSTESSRSMSKRFTEENEPMPPDRMTATAAYSARLQEAMRYDRLRSSDYPLVMSIMRAVSQGFTEERWEAEKQSNVRALQKNPTDKQLPHADAASRFEQTIAGLKDLALWPW
jgi:hypothetical protein